MLTRAFGLNLHFDSLSPPGAWGARERGSDDLVLRAASPSEVAAAWSGAESLGWEATIDGLYFAVEQGAAGDHRFVHGEQVSCHLSADGATLLCALGSGGEAGRWRIVLDSILFSVALLHGFEALHAGAVVIDRGAIAIAARAGGGKSTLLAQLLACGCALLSDDIVVLEPRPDAAPRAHPGPPLMTVPTGATPLPGEEIFDLGEERWLAMPTVTAPAPLIAIVLLDRRPGATTSLGQIEEPLVQLLSSLLRFPSTPERERSRFNVAAELAARVPIWGLRADPTVTPSVLADLVRGVAVPSEATRD